MTTIDVMCPPCPNCRRTSILTVPAEGYRQWRDDGTLIQHALPELDADQRELLITGTHAHCWESMWADNTDVITPPCPFCGKTSVVTVPVAGLSLWHDHDVFDLSRAFPHLPDAERELLISGTHAGCER